MLAVQYAERTAYAGVLSSRAFFNKKIENIPTIIAWSSAIYTCIILQPQYTPFRERFETQENHC